MQKPCLTPWQALQRLKQENQFALNGWQYSQENCAPQMAPIQDFVPTAYNEKLGIFACCSGENWEKVTAQNFWVTC